MIRFITLEELLPLRRDVLRPNKTKLEDCIFPTDRVDGAFHLGFYDGGELVCIASFHPQPCAGFAGAGYQLRGMATHPARRGRGIGNQLLNFAIVYLRGQKANYIWCNARKTALGFYLNMGFEIVSGEFEVPEIGPHFVLYLRIQ